jgi:hypothetical protein
MAWRRGKGRADGAAQGPPLEPIEDMPEMLPVLVDEGTTSDREAYKQLKKAEADLKKLKKKQTRAEKREEKRLLKIDRDLARRERSRNVGPIRLVLNLAVLNGVAAAMALLLLWRPEWSPYDPLFQEDNFHWWVATICFIGAAGICAYLLSTNPAVEFLDRSRLALWVYMAFGLVAIFSGILLAFVLVGMETIELDWVFWQWVLVILAAGSAVPFVAIYLVAHRSDSRWFLTGAYHLVMGILSAILMVALLLLPFAYLPAEGLMWEVGLSLMVVGWLVMLFPLPALMVSAAVEAQGRSIHGLYWWSER